MPVLLIVRSILEAVGSVGSVQLSRAASGVQIQGELEYDATRLIPAQPSVTVPLGRYPVELPPRSERIFALRALPMATGQVFNVGVSGLSAKGLYGETAQVRIDGKALLTVGVAK